VLGLGSSLDLELVVLLGFRFRVSGFIDEASAGLFWRHFLLLHNILL
jgi:hypothetical protein